MTVSKFASDNKLEILSMSNPDREICGCYIGDLLSWVMGRAKADDAWVTIMSNQNVLAVASLCDVSCIIFAEGVKPEKDIIELAKEKGINLLCCEKPAYETACLISKAL